MKLFARLENRSGFNLIEVLIAASILGIVTMGLVQIQGFMSRQNVSIKEGTFANQKAMQMLEELRSLVAGSEKIDVSVLDDYDDGSLYKTVLTTDLATTDPASALSGNTPGPCGGWKYLRQISVIKVPDDPFARRVFVRIYKGACPLSTPQAAGESLAQTMTVLKTIKSQFVPTQVLDVYVIAIENVAGWWSSLPTMRPLFDSILSDLQSRNPGLELRTHWIDRLSYGRDPYYAPNVNKAVRTNAAPAPLVYLYPGLTQDDTGSDYKFYDPDGFMGRVQVDSVLTNTATYASDGTFLQNTYSLCDQFNHAVREPDEEALYNQAVATSQAAGVAPPEPSWRLLLEWMNSGRSGNYSAYKNIMLINLHGELLPLPPMHNYSDAAKDPAVMPNVRVVAHPERIAYTAATNIKLRVYTYAAAGHLGDFAGSGVNASSVPYTSIFLPNDYVDFSAANVTYIAGNSGAQYTAATVATKYTSIQSAASVAAGSFSITHPTAGSTLITLYNTPIRHGFYNGDSSHKQGLPDGTTGSSADMKLYGMEYIPFPTGPAGSPDFTTNLTTNSDSLPKNTARWIITIPIGGAAGLAGGQRHTVETRIGTDTATGTTANAPYNLSRTYVWINAAVPFTEQYQFTGDAAYCPYSDVVSNSGYNWYFRTAPTGYNNLGKTAAGWSGDSSHIDVPRYMQMVRNGLLQSNAIWSTMNGWSYYYYGFGGEFGSDMAPLANSLPFVMTPWLAARDVTTNGRVNEIINYTGDQQNSRLITRTDTSWYCKPWLGELFPDDDYVYWTSNGNLPTNLNVRGVPNYYRATYPAAGALSRNVNFRFQPKGCASFFNGSKTSSTHPFNHSGQNSATGAATTLTANIAAMFNFPMLDSLTAPRPFTLSDSGNDPPEWNDATYSGMRTTIEYPSIGSVERSFYNSSYSTSYRSSALVRMKTGTNSAYVAVSGFGTQANFGTAEIGKYMSMLVMRAFIDGGMYTGQDHITQVPMVNITSPTPADDFVNPTSINIGWSTSWNRWDGQKYTEEYPALYIADNAVGLRFLVKYSNDSTKTWKFCSDNSPAPGDGLTAEQLQSGTYDSQFTTANSMVWNVSDATTFKRGSYVIRVEAYRTDFFQDYAYHPMQIYINR